MTDALPAEVLACVERTLAEPSARVAFEQEMTAAWPPLRRRRGGAVPKLLGATVGRLAKRWLKGHMTAIGVIEPARRRYRVDHGHYAEVGIEGRRWSGRSGRTLDSLPARRVPPGIPDVRPDVLWMLDVCRGIVEAVEEGSGYVRGWPCRRVAARVDLERASEATPGGLKVPAVERFDELRSLPFEIWIDGEHVRGVRSAVPVTASVRYTLELWDFGIDTSDADWTRLPTNQSADIPG
jgi:hypothetical protein